MIKALGWGRLNKEDGFTIAEMLVTMLIIGVLASVALPTFLNTSDGSRDLSAKNQLGITYHELHTFYPQYNALTDQAVDDVRGSEPELYIINNSTYAQGVVAIEIVTPTKAILRTQSPTGAFLCMIDKEGAQAGTSNNWDGSASTAECASTASPEAPVAGEPVLPPDPPAPPDPDPPTPPSPVSMFYDAAAFSLNALNMSNSTLVNGSVASNKQITLTNSAKVCGNATPGPGYSFSGGSNSLCPSYSSAPGSTVKNPAPVNASTPATSNINNRICAADACTGSVTYNSTTKTLSISNTGVLTLSGTGNYYFCSITLSNKGEIKIASGAAPVIYIGGPEACGAGKGNLDIGNQATLVNLNAQAQTLTICMAGSPTATTTAAFNNSFQASTILSLYAPRTNITLNNSATVVGALLGKSVTMSNSSTLIYDSTVANAICAS